MSSFKPRYIRLDYTNAKPGMMYMRYASGNSNYRTYYIPYEITDSSFSFLDITHIDDDHISSCDIREFDDTKHLTYNYSGIKKNLGLFHITNRDVITALFKTP